EAASGRGEWTALDPAAKRERLLAAATEIFARDGLDAPMSVVAEAAGAGVASVYRLYESKRELLAALVVRRMEALTATTEEAIAQPRGRWEALTGMLTSVVSAQRAASLIGDALATVADRPDVAAAVARASEAQERLLAAAPKGRGPRAGATSLGLRVVFA